MDFDAVFSNYASKCFMMYLGCLALQPWIPFQQFLPFIPLLCFTVGLAGILLKAKSEEKGMYLSEGT